MHDLHVFHSPPFPKENQLCNELDSIKDSHPIKVSPTPSVCLPGQPCIKVTDSTRLNEFLTAEFWAEDLENISHKLWVMTTPSSSNINSLHRQLVKGRHIVVTEDPRLHLVWIHGRIFIKPIPTYLMSHQFWTKVLLKQSYQPTSSLTVDRDSIKRAALGFLRTYAYLIRHQSDFMIAQQDNLRLVPPNIDWTKFCQFVSNFSKIQDDHVSGRYQYGELRLTRLNFYAKFFLGKFYYEQIYGQYGDYFSRLYAPILFIFAIASTILNAMQVEMAAEQILDTPSMSLGLISSWVSRISSVGIGFVAFSFSFLWLWLFLDEWIYTLKRRPWRRHRKRTHVDY